MAIPSNKSKKNFKKRSSWVGPVLAGTAGLIGVGLLSRRASAKPATPSPTPSGEPKSQPSTDDIRFPVFEDREGASLLEDLLEATGLDGQWRRFFLSTARGESGFTSNIVLGDPKLYPHGSKPSSLTDTLGPGEAKGARTAYDRAVEQKRFDGCPWPASAYTWGSGGWLGMLPANAWYAYLGTSLRCRHPWYLLHPVDHVVTAIEFARRLMGWKTFTANPNWLRLRVGWGNPSAMDDVQVREAVAKKFGVQLEALGVDKAFMLEKVTPLPKRNVEDTWDTLMRQFDLEPGKRGA